ncbi:alanine:cation symporter family protein, partial [Parabacteroides distasonis]
GSGIMLSLRYGVARGLFSSESGMGSAPIAAAAAQTHNPVRQALVSSTGTFWDTVVLCAITGLVLVSSIMKNPGISVSAVDNGGVLTTLAFCQIPYLGPVILVFGIVL